ncbi:chemotaxis protein CheW [Roseateles sp. BYS87W]|uniref:Chemotaxis protein CheW n=1 Tax=Pelomonas baiyunensis TaxID=3299026 RepID=A0ABW7GUZ9_9BURK
MTALSLIEHHAVEAASPREVLTCRLGTEEYGLDILAVQEIRRYEAPTRIANAAIHMLGVMNLRGVIVPILDLRYLLGVPAEVSTNTVTIVVNVAGRTVGLVVDAVSDVLALTPKQVKPRPALGRQTQADFIVGLAHVSHGDVHRLLLLMDLPTLLQDL